MKHPLESRAPAWKIGLAWLCLCSFLEPAARSAEVTVNESQRSTNAPVLLTPARVFGTADGEVHEGWAVLVIGTRIAAVGPSAQMKPPSNAVVLDLSGMTLLPGLMDIHPPQRSSGSQRHSRDH